MSLPTDELKLLKVVKELMKWSDVTMSVCNDGITNKLYRITHSTGDTILVRIYGNSTDLLIDRKRELKNMRMLHELGEAETVYAEYTNGLAYGYKSGRTISIEEVKQVGMVSLIAQKMAKWHDFEIDSNSVTLFTTLDTWLLLLTTLYESRDFHFTTLQHFIDSYTQLKTHLLTHVNQSNIGFCHNDLLLGNIIVNTNTVDFIDYEYSGTNYISFDIANHFIEMMGLELDFTLFPSREFMLHWLSVYVDSRVNVSKFKVEELVEEVLLFVPACHLFWCVWALVM